MSHRQYFSALLLFVAAAAPSCAQQDRFSLYALSSNTFVSNASRGETYSSTSSFGGPPNYGPVTSPGFAIGASVRLFNAGPLTVTFDLRDSSGIGTQYANSFSGGIQIASRQYHHRLRPYAQFSYGIFTTYVSSANPTTINCQNLPCTAVIPYTETDYFGYEVFAGTDFRISRHFDLRAFELGIGNARPGPADPSLQNMSTLNANTGLLVHF